MQGFSGALSPLNEHEPLTRSLDTLRIAVLCEHDLSYLEPGDKIHTYEKMITLAVHASVVLFTPKGHASRDMKSRMKVVQINARGMGFRLALILALIAHRDDYDCIYARDPSLMFLAVPIKIFRKALVLEMNGIPSLETEIRRKTQKVRMPALTPLICTATRITERIAVSCADLVLPVTKKMKATIVNEYGARPEKVLVIPNSVDTAVFRPLEDSRKEMRNSLGIRRETVVLYLGTFSARWRMSEQFFRVADDIRHKRSDVLFLVVGTGPLLDKIKVAFRELVASGRALWIGAVDHNLVPSYINASDIYVYDVAQVENKLIQKQGLCPTKVLEAMACAKPVVAFKEAELESLFRESKGGFCISSLQEMESLVLELADRADLARSTGANGRRYVELNHDLTRLTHLTVELIRGAVSSKRS